MISPLSLIYFVAQQSSVMVLGTVALCGMYAGGTLLASTDETGVLLGSVSLLERPQQSQAL
jgi:hypothetical protein